MPNILALNKIAKIGLDRFGEGYNVGEDVADPVGILVRSASLHDYEIPESVVAIARAGAGVNNIPCDECAERGIVVFNTPGANANAVKELVLAALLISSRKVIPGVEWARSLKGKGADVPKLVEGGKGEFVGPEIGGKKLGVMGLGAIGILVANAAEALGMDVLGYDPFLSLDAAWGLSNRVRRASTLEEIYQKCDYITMHIPLNSETSGMIDQEAISLMKDGVRIINFSRAELVDGPAIVEALGSGKAAAYVVDFPTDEVLGVDGVIAIPHLGASTPESEDNCAVMAVKELRKYIEFGSIRNAVSYPDLDCGVPEGRRACVLHTNIPGVLTQLSNAFTAQGLNIENMLSKSKKNYAYTVFDFEGELSDLTVSSLAAVEGVIKVRVI